MTEQEKTLRTVYVGNGVQSEEWIDPPAKFKKSEKKDEPKHDSKGKKD